jgi:hypothetical protein
VALLLLLEVAVLNSDRVLRGAACAEAEDEAEVETSSNAEGLRGVLLRGDGEVTVFWCDADRLRENTVSESPSLNDPPVKYSVYRPRTLDRLAVRCSREGPGGAFVGAASCSFEDSSV